nr:MAG TPA: hypothetical protein [Caudoviricetes sp.]
MDNENIFLNTTMVNNTIKHNDMIASVRILLEYKEFCNSGKRFDLFNIIIESYLNDLTGIRNTDTIPLEDVNTFLLNYKYDKDWCRNVDEIMEYFFNHNIKYIKKVSEYSGKTFIVKKK